ncbi:MAG: hypothetical protein U9R50_03290 [Campylobacterota bacterium]|nr:hypothetical protein [Campylobacterota bacterium]
MIAFLKRFGMALVFLLLVVVLMLLGTMAVTSFGKQMLGESNVTMSPRGEKVEL